MAFVGDMNLNGKILAITGGGSGIHLELARIARSKGAKVIIADLKLTEEATVEVERDSANLVFLPCDVMKRSELENIVTTSECVFGDCPDVYVAGAGVFEPTWSNFWDDTESDDYKAVQVNINHPIKLTRIATRALLGRNKKGVVLIMASMTGYTGHFSAPLYSATKHALVGFVRSMVDLDRHEGVKVVAICPGENPLWLADPERSARFGYQDSIAISARSVAEAELNLIENGSYQGGTVYEISTAGERTIGTWNISPPGPSSESPLVGTVIPQEALDRAYEPIWSVLARERLTD
ncbi:NAD(P)-binding protein [Penicillium frequentans]|nr:NAD(P)-binding protein [Penicillium glabrum]